MQERQGTQCYGTLLLYDSDDTSLPHDVGVSVVSASTLEAVHATTQGLASARPLIVEALVDPCEYDEVILRPHK